MAAIEPENGRSFLGRISETLAQAVVGFRGRFILVGLLIILPFLAALSLQSRHDLRDEAEQARAQARGFLQAIIDHRGEPIQHMRLLISELALSYDFSDAACTTLQTGLLDRHAWAREIWVADTKGTPLCSGRLLNLDAATSQAYVSAVNRERGFVLVLPPAGRSAAVPAVAAQPVMRDGKTAGIIGIAVDPSWIGRQLSDIADNADMSVIIGKPDGSIAGAYLGGEPDHGPVLSQALRQALQRGNPDGDLVVAPDARGTARIFVAARLGNTGFNIAVGLPQQRFAEPMHRQARQMLLTLMIVLLASTMLGLLGIEFVFLRPLGRFGIWLDAIGRGDYRGTHAPRGLSREFRGLVDALSRMAGEIQARESQLSQSERRYRLIAENMSDMIIVADRDLNATYASQRSSVLYGKAPDLLIGRDIGELIHPEYRARFLSSCRAVLGGQDQPPCIMPVAGDADPEMWVEAAVQRMPDRSGHEVGAIVIVMRDVTARKIMEDRLAEANRQLHLLATSDTLTGLGNRRCFDEAIQREWREAERRQEPLSLLFLDVDHFKLFNDRYGHPAGDTCLREVGAAIRQSINRPNDLATRYGGEEFAILLPNTDDSGAFHIAENLRRMVRELELMHQDSPLGRVTISIGVATIVPRRDLGMATLIARADRALYGAKRDGRNRVRHNRQDDFNLIQIPA